MSLEQVEDIQIIAHERIVAQQFTEKVKVIHAHSLSFQVQEKIDLLVLDADLNTRLAEFKHFETALSPAAFVIVHDAHHPQVYADLQAIVTAGRLKMLYLPTPRGASPCANGLKQANHLGGRCKYRFDCALAFVLYIKRCLPVQSKPPN